MKIIIAVLLLSISTFAQSRADVGVSISAATQSFGYDNPEVGVVGHFVKGRVLTDSWKDRTGFEGEVCYFPRAYKAQTHDGTAISGSATARLYFNGRDDAAPFFFSGGVEVAHQSTSLYSKTAAGPRVGFGIDIGVLTVQAAYDHLFGENQSDGFTLAGEWAIGFGKHAYASLRPFVVAARFSTPHAIDGVDRRESGARGGVVLAFGWR